MAINILGLNAKEAILVRNQPSTPMRLKVNADEIKEKIQKAKENGEISKYYGLSPVFDEAMVNALNKMKEELSRITNRPFKPSVVGEASGIVSVATNQELISNISDVFKDVDLTDEDAVKNAISKYNELVKPAYLANGAQAESVNHINNWLNNDAKKFISLIANIRRSQLYKPMDISV